MKKKVERTVLKFKTNEKKVLPFEKTEDYKARMRSIAMMRNAEKINKQ